MDNKINFDLNNSDCIKEKIFLTHTNYTNICNGESYTINNGINDYTWFFVTSVIVLLIVVLIVSLIKLLILAKNI